MIVRAAGLFLLMFALLGLTAQIATACPPGTVFSAKADGTNGICAIIGQGATAAVKCTVRQGACHNGDSREHSGNDPTRDYCCPRNTFGKFGQGVRQCVRRGTGPFCAGECLPGEYFDGQFATGTMGCATGHVVICCNLPR